MTKNINIEILSKLINISGRQRMLSQRIGFLIMSKHLGHEGQLEQTIQLFEESHNLLKNGNQEFPKPDEGSSIYNYFYGAKAADQKIKEYILQAKRASRGSEAEVKEFFDVAHTAIVPLLNDAVMLYEAESKNKSSEVDESIIELNEHIKFTFGEIDKILQMTKIISFNASVIAARNGESGKEFSVVSIEIQKLTGQIDDLIKATLAKLDDAA